MKRSNRRYHILLALILVLIAAYTVFWFVMRDIAEKRFNEQVAAMKTRGEISFTSAEWSGYPIRLQVDIVGLKYRGHGAELEADRFHAEVLPWAPTRAIVRADGNVRLALREAARTEWIEFRPVTAIASVRFSFAGLFEGTDIELRQPRADGTDWNGNEISFHANRMQFDIRNTGRAGETPDSSAPPLAHDSYQLALSADALVISDGFAPTLGPRIDSIRFAAWAKGLPPASHLLGAEGVAGAGRLMKEAGSYLEVARLDFDWGGVAARGTGRFALDEALRPEGEVLFKVTGLAKFVDAMVKNGTLEPSSSWVATMAEAAPFPFSIKDGVMSFGPFAMGEAPSLQ